MQVGSDEHIIRLANVTSNGRRTCCVRLASLWGVNLTCQTTPEKISNSSRPTLFMDESYLDSDVVPVQDIRKRNDSINRNKSRVKIPSSIFHPVIDAKWKLKIHYDDYDDDDDGPKVCRSFLDDGRLIFHQSPGILLTCANLFQSPFSRLCLRAFRFNNPLDVPNISKKSTRFKEKSGLYMKEASFVGRLIRSIRADKIRLTKSLANSYLANHKHKLK